MIDFIFDVETYSELELKIVGSVKYALHPSTEITFISYKFSAYDRLKYWSPFENTPVPADLLDVANHPEKYRFVAHNIEFDYLIWLLVFKKTINQAVVRPPLSNVHDNMAASNYFRLGSSLEANAAMLRVPLRKHPEGRAMMLKLCKPYKGGRYQPTAQEYGHFKAYGNGDTDILALCHYSMPELPSFERWVWEWTFRTNLTGIRIDVPLLLELKKIIDKELPKMNARFFQIVGCTVNSHVKVKEFFKRFYPWIEDMRKDTVNELFLDTTPVPDYVREALDLKFLAGSTAISKVFTACDMLVGDRVYNLFDFAKAITKRFAGKGLQPQNFPRFDSSRRDKIDFDVNSPDLAAIVRERAHHLVDPIGFVKNLLRRIWLPDFDYEWFYAGDFSKIEPTVLFWLLNMGPIPKKWYEELASKIYGTPVDLIDKEGHERQVGKAGQLSCGYGSGWRSFRLKTFQDTGILLTEDEAKKVVYTYREMYPLVVKFWDDLEKAFSRAIQGGTTRLCDGRIVFQPMPHPWNGVMATLPSGAKLYYHGAGQGHVRIKKDVWSIVDGRKVKTKVEEDVMSYYYMEADSKGRLTKKSVYGGLLCENSVSATAREVMTPAMWRLENAGFKVPGTVHDELWAIGKPGADKEIEHLMSITPTWAQGMVVTTEVQGGVRYLK